MSSWSTTRCGSREMPAFPKEKSNFYCSTDPPPLNQKRSAPSLADPATPAARLVPPKPLVHSFIKVRNPRYQQMGSTKTKRGGGYGFRWVFFSLRSSQGNAVGLNSSCVGANCIDAREHGAPTEQTACTRVTQRRARRVVNPFKLPQVPPAWETRSPLCSKSSFENKEAIASPSVC